MVDVNTEAASITYEINELRQRIKWTKKYIQQNDVKDIANLHRRIEHFEKQIAKLYRRLGNLRR